MSDAATRVIRVRPVGGRVISVRFAGDRQDHKLDMTGLMARSVHFAPLVDDPQSFAKVAIVEGGLGVAWPIKTKRGRLDVFTSTLRLIAEEQASAAHDHGITMEDASSAFGGSIIDR
jgi:hypothetical protein